MMIFFTHLQHKSNHAFLSYGVSSVIFHLFLLITDQSVSSERSGRARFVKFQVPSRCVCDVSHSELSSYLSVLLSFYLGLTQSSQLTVTTRRVYTAADTVEDVKYTE